MTSWPVVKGYKLRATKINSCGMPIAGAGNRLVTSGFITANLTMVQQPAQDLEQSNAEGLICVSDRTPPQRKWYTPAIELCDVDPELITLMSGWPMVLDHADQPVGYRDATMVDEDYGVALEIWTGGKSFDDCPTPTSDSVFSTVTTGVSYGYFLFGGVEWIMGDIRIGASVATFTLTGRTIAMPFWGKGPYNVAAIDANGTPGRLLVPVGQDEHYTAFRTPVPPPESTFGAVSLGIQSLFVGPPYYYGGPGHTPGSAVAPDQAAATSVTITITGAPTGGNFTLLITGDFAENSLELQSDSTADEAVAAVVALADYREWDTSEFTATGGPLPTTPIVLNLPFLATVEPGENNLEGGTIPTVTVT